MIPRRSQVPPGTADNQSVQRLATTDDPPPPHPPHQKPTQWQFSKEEERLPFPTSGTRCSLSQRNPSRRLPQTRFSFSLFQRTAPAQREREWGEGEADESVSPRTFYELQQQRKRTPSIPLSRQAKTWQRVLTGL